MKCSKRLQLVPASPIRKLVPYATAAKKQGIKVYHLNIGDPDVLTPKPMLSVLRNWDSNPIGYDQSQGNPEFLTALKIYYQKLGFKFISEEHIQVTTGGSEAISMAMFAACEAGDEIIVFEPFYANYNSYAVVCGVRLVPIRTEIENGFHLPRPIDIIKRITPRTKAILICNPNNPTGTVYNQKEMDMLIEICRKHDLFLLSDEVYREYAYDGAKQVSALSYMKKMPDRVIVLDSMSKRYSLCGARLGCIVTLNSEFLSGVLRIGQGRLSSGLVDQMVAAKLTEVPDSYLTKVNAEYTKRRDTLYQGLRKIPGVYVPKPEGAFYMIVSLPVDDAEKFCQWLLTDFRERNETVMLAPAAGFYATAGLGTREVRIAYVLNTTALSRSLELLSLALKMYPGKILK